MSLPVGIIVAAFAILSIALLLVFERLRRGPGLADRVIALDVICYVAMGFIAVHALATGQPVFLDIAMVLALMAFLGTIAFARYLEGTARMDEQGGRE